MKWNIISLRQNPGTSETKSAVITAEEFGHVPGLTMVQPLTIDATITYDHDSYQLTGQMSTVLELKCSRCLESFLYNVQVELHEEFRQGNPEEGRDEINWFYGDNIDLDDTLRQNLLLVVPMKPICTVNCQGLCPHCGVNRNITQCDCHNQQIDPRMAVLRKLLE